MARPSLTSRAAWLLAALLLLAPPGTTTAAPAPSAAASLALDPPVLASPADEASGVPTTPTLA